MFNRFAKNICKMINRQFTLHTRARDDKNKVKLIDENKANFNADIISTINLKVFRKGNINRLSIGQLNINSP